MPYYVLAFYEMLLAITLAAFWWGGWEERSTAVAFCSATVASLLVRSPRGQRYAQVETGLLAVDLLLLALLVWLAVRSGRRWLMVIVALHAVSTAGHIARAVDISLWRFAYGLMVTLPSYATLVALAWGVWVAARRTRDVARS